MSELCEVNSTETPGSSCHGRLVPYSALILAFLLAAISLPSLWNPAYYWWNYGTKCDERIVETSAFTLRIRAYKERAIMAVPGGYYEYCTKDRSSIFWQKKALFRLFTFEPIPRDQVVGVTDDTVFFYQGSVFGITTDRGANWTLLGGYGQYPPILTGISDRYDCIEGAEILRDGTGTMILTSWVPSTADNWSSEPIERLPSLLLRTSDFGAHWQQAESPDRASQCLTSSFP